MVFFYISQPDCQRPDETEIYFGIAFPSCTWCLKRKQTSRRSLELLQLWPKPVKNCILKVLTNFDNSTHYTRTSPRRLDIVAFQSCPWVLALSSTKLVSIHETVAFLFHHYKIRWQHTSGKAETFGLNIFFLYSGITAMSWNRHSLPESSLSYTSLKSISSTAVSFNSVQELPRQCQRSYFRCSFGWTHEKTCWPRDYALLQDKTFEFRRLSVAKSIFPIIRSAVKKNSRSTTTTSN